MNLKQLGTGVEQKGSMDGLLDQRLWVLEMIEQLDKPAIAVLCRYFLGGGLVLPLACHFRLPTQEGCQIGLLAFMEKRKPDFSTARTDSRSYGKPENSLE